jgi:hypothetical protein
MDETTAEAMTTQFDALPDEALDRFLELNRSSFRIMLVPGYRTITLLGRPIGCEYPYLLHASGSGRTNVEGQFTISISRLLHCVGSGAPMPPGLMVPVESGEAEVPGSGTLSSGSPVTVVTAVGPKPALFTAEVSGFQATAPQPNIVYLGWKGIITQISQPESIVIRSFQPNGPVFPRAQFNWHVTLEVWFTLISG